MEKERFVIGLGGPTGGGKTAAGKILAKHGFLEIDTDAVSHRILDEKKDLVVAEFSGAAEKKGLPLLDGEGNILRKNLGKLLFSDSSLLKRHESLIYPELKKYIEKEIHENSNRNIVVNGAVLYKIPEILSLCDFVLYIYSPFFTRLARLARRDRIPFYQLVKRMKAQKNLFAKYSEQYADIVKVKNRGTLENLEKNLLAVLARYGL